jgi:hypothetical protein
MALKAVYFVRILAVLSLTTVALVADQMRCNDNRGLRPVVVGTRYMAFLCLCACSALLAMVIWRLSVGCSITTVAKRAHLPYDSLIYVRSRHFSGNMLNDFDWGGFLIYQLPECKTFVDGRMPSWHDGRGNMVTLYSRLVIPGNVSAVRDCVARFDIGWALLARRSPLAANLRYLGWTRAYDDDTAVIMVRAISK